MKLPNKVYDNMKWVLTIVAPAVIVLIKALGAIYNFNTDAITAYKTAQVSATVDNNSVQ